MVYLVFKGSRSYCKNSVGKNIYRSVGIEILVGLIVKILWVKIFVGFYGGGSCKVDWVSLLTLGHSCTLWLVYHIKCCGYNIYCYAHTGLYGWVIISSVVGHFLLLCSYRVLWLVNHIRYIGNFGLSYTHTGFYY